MLAPMARQLLPLSLPSKAFKMKPLEMAVSEEAGFSLAARSEAVLQPVILKTLYETLDRACTGVSLRHKRDRIEVERVIDESCIPNVFSILSVGWTGALLLPVRTGRGADGLGYAPAAHLIAPKIQDLLRATYEERSNGAL